MVEGKYVVMKVSKTRKEKDHLILLWILIKKERQRLKLSIYRRKDLEKSGIRAIRKKLKKM